MMTAVLEEKVEKAARGWQYYQAAEIPTAPIHVMVNEALVQMNGLLTRMSTDLKTRYVKLSTLVITLRADVAQLVEQLTRNE